MLVMLPCNIGFRELNWLLQISFFESPSSSFPARADLNRKFARHVQHQLQAHISCIVLQTELKTARDQKLSVIRTHNDLISRQSTSNWSWIIRRLFWLTIPVFYWAKRGALYLGREKAAIKVRPRRSPNNFSRFTSAGNCWRFEFPNFNGSSDATKYSHFGASKRSHKATTNLRIIRGSLSRCGRFVWIRIDLCRDARW